MALPMMLIVVTAEIDLSVASTLGMAGALLGDLWHHGWGIWPALIAALAVGVVGGALNGVLVAKAGLPSIAVTIARLLMGRAKPWPSSGATRYSTGLPLSRTAATI